MFVRLSSRAVPWDTEPNNGKEGVEGESRFLNGQLEGGAGTSLYSNGEDQRSNQFGKG